MPSSHEWLAGDVRIQERIHVASVVGMDVEVFRASRADGTLLAAKRYRVDGNPSAFWARMDGLIDIGRRSEDPSLALPIGRSGNLVFLPWVDGESIASRVRKSGPLGLDRALEVCLRIARALEHLAGLASRALPNAGHGDLNPENVLLTRDSEPYLIDFDHFGGPIPRSGFLGQRGLAASLTARGMGVYQCPEFLTGAIRYPDAAGDVFALGHLLSLLAFGVPSAGRTYRDRLLEYLAGDPAIAGLPSAARRLPAAARTEARRVLALTTALDRTVRLRTAHAIRTEFAVARDRATRPGPVDVEYRGFSCPFEPWNARFASQLACAYARGTTAVFVRRYEASLRATKLVGALTRTLDAASFDLVWNPVFGRLRREVIEPANPVVTAAMVALRGHAFGVPGRWRCRFDRPEQLSFGKWLLPAASEVSVEARRREVVIQSDRADRVVFARDSGAWSVLAGADSLTSRFERVPRSSFDVVTLDGASEYRRNGTLEEVELRESGESPFPAWGAAFQLLARCAPEYRRWVTNVLRTVFPAKSPPDRLNSGSHPDIPGVIAVSVLNDPIAVAEMFVHESTHQYFNLLTRLGPCVDGSDRSLHYSPFRRQGRPLDRLLVAYHAFANVLLMYRACRAAGADDGYVDRNEPRLLAQLREVERPLERTRSLTDVGRAIFEPLRIRVALGGSD